jgi:prophage maintenance system killer protein
VDGASRHNGAVDEARTIELYESPDGAVRLDVRGDGETVWLTQVQMSELFGADRNTIGEHLGNVFAEGEVDGEATTRNFRVVRREGSRDVSRNLTHYNLDAVLSVGYRVRSASATAFRRWSNDVLRRYILTGSAVNERRLAELGVLTGILARSRDENVAGLADVLHRYTGDFDLLNAYDKGEFDVSGGTEPTWNMNLADAREVVAAVRVQFPSDKMFGAERGPGFAGIIGQVEQTSFGQPLYPTVEDRAANLIYLTVKNHPFADGNKRSAAAIASVYLERNGVRPLPPNTLAALTLVAASSEAAQKDQIIGVLRTVLVRNSE